MKDLREALLAPSPKGISENTLSETVARDEESVRQSIARGEDLEELRGAAFHNRTWVISDRYCNVGDGVDSLEGYLHDLWHMYYQVARHTAHETPEHDRGRGVLTRPAPGVFGVDIARTVEGTLWNDLPFLVTDMTKFWVDNAAKLSSAHRVNFASFLAKLAATRISKDRVCQIALVLFRSALEEPRELNTGQGSDQEDRSRDMRELDVVHLLPSVSIWIKEAGYNLIQLSDVSWNDCPSAVGEGGTMFVESVLGKRCPYGFTPWRWMFWLKRLYEIRDEAKEAKEERLEEYAADAIESMREAVVERNSEILRAYKNAGKDVHEEKHLSCLKDPAQSLEELAMSRMDDTGDSE
ncbi:hypothetical protein J7337_013080 [Fusarium musae]|uniref:Uncharacterized protein n=1 Tax=Fusarium musae TaxID=1042133 RepID=A0A9P8D403_9HYPO|nr:hypothetical protein J7337_013080 [Fusarium musae]KAG9494851.1 hypothetical protein J7337_013080 [Fusarium musae]